MTTSEAPREVAFKARGAILEAWRTRNPEALLEGGAGTGKTRGALELMHALALQYPGFRGLIVRKVGVTLTTSTLVTFNQHVRPQQDGVRWFGGSKDKPAAYYYPAREVAGEERQSVIVVGGLETPADGSQAKVLGSEYDFIFPDEAIELTIEDWETLMSRLRPFVLRHPRILAATNPGPQSHWLNVRCDTGEILRLKTTLRDNPVYYDERGELTEEGEAYLQRLGRLTGTRRARLLDGVWVGHENAIYPHYDPLTHIRPLPDGIVWRDGATGGDTTLGGHAAAGVAIRVDQYGRRWVTEVFKKEDHEHGRLTSRELGRLRYANHAWRMCVGPDSDWLRGHPQTATASLAKGPRWDRIDEVDYLLASFPGGRVPESRHAGARDPLEMHGPYPPDPLCFGDTESPGLLIVQGCEGAEILDAELQAYHKVWRESVTGSGWEVVRVDDDAVSALECACHALRLPRVTALAQTVNLAQMGR